MSTDKHWFHSANHQGFHAEPIDSSHTGILRHGVTVGMVTSHANGSMLLRRHDIPHDPDRCVVPVGDVAEALSLLTSEADAADAAAKNAERLRVRLLSLDSREAFPPAWHHMPTGHASLCGDWWLSRDEARMAEWLTRDTMGLPELPSLLQNTRVCHTRYTASRNKQHEENQTEETELQRSDDGEDD
jgi:hypothetical protein